MILFSFLTKTFITGLALYGETYWLIHPECEKLPDSYEKWVENALSRYSLDDCYEFMSKNNNVTNKA